PRRGTPGLHPIIDLGNELAVDLGFRFYRELTSASKLQPGDIVRLSDAGIRKVDAATKAQLFTYTATVRTITDGDTLLVALILAPGFTHRLKLRLRGLDCPEVATAAGRAAKAFVENLLRPGDEVIISTTKPDKYDRYLADVFIVPSKDVAGLVEPGPGSTPPATAPIFLNNALLSARYDGGAKEE
ncbi:MAG: thermonuclease family protein, partial [Undibacterium sp.]|nr:thermonuclease family protein [Opitutaceae bacterium]